MADLLPTGSLNPSFIEPSTEPYPILVLTDTLPSRQSFFEVKRNY